MNQEPNRLFAARWSLEQLVFPEPSTSRKPRRPDGSLKNPRAVPPFYHRRMERTIHTLHSAVQKHFLSNLKRAMQGRYYWSTTAAAYRAVGALGAAA